MGIDQELVVVWIALFVQLLGAIGVAVARLSQRRGTGRLGMLITIACVVLVGALSLGTMESRDRSWIIFATTLPLMAVGATLDMRRSATRAAF